MDPDKTLIVFQGKKIRRIWFNDEWWFSIVDIIEALTQTDRARKYWSDLKIKLTQECFELSEKIGQLKLMAEDFNHYLCLNSDENFVGANGKVEEIIEWERTMVLGEEVAAGRRIVFEHF